jgi:hypothetical protein
MDRHHYGTVARKTLHHHLFLFLFLFLSLCRLQPHLPFPNHLLETTWQEKVLGVTDEETILAGVYSREGERVR